MDFSHVIAKRFEHTYYLILVDIMALDDELVITPWIVVE
jgi:hypothetical protein